jgi:hypothetical protein
VEPGTKPRLTNDGQLAWKVLLRFVLGIAILAWLAYVALTRTGGERWPVVGGAGLGVILGGLAVYGTAEIDRHWKLRRESVPIWIWLLWGAAVPLGGAVAPGAVLGFPIVLVIFGMLAGMLLLMSLAYRGVR